MIDVVRSYLPWVLSSLTIWMTLAAGNQKPHAWLVGLFNQGLCFSWIVVSEAWGLLPLTAVLTVVYWRNHRKWAARAD